MRKAWRYWGAGIAVLALLGIGTYLANRDRSREASGESAIPVLQVPGSPQAGDELSAPIELFLLPDGNVKAIPTSVRIGLGYVSPDDAAGAQLGNGEEPEAAGTDNYYDLAAVTHWASAPAEQQADGRVRVGPLRLPRADRYAVQARGEDGLRYYATVFAPKAVPSAIMPLVGAGIRVQVATSDTRILLRRVNASVEDAVWQQLQKWVAPELLEAFSDQSLPGGIVNF